MSCCVHGTGGAKRRRSLGQVLFSGFLTLAGVSVVAFAIVQTHDDLNLRHRGISASATVLNMRRTADLHPSNDYLITFTLADATPFQLWTTRVDQHTAVGDTITVFYQSGRPGDATDARILGRWWLAPAFLMPFGSLIVLGSWLLWRIETERTTSQILRNSYSRWRD